MAKYVMKIWPILTSQRCNGIGSVPASDQNGGIFLVDGFHAVCAPVGIYSRVGLLKNFYKEF
jgi:hypothetical protein